MRNLEIGSLRALISIVDLGGVGRAAEDLNLTQSAISMQVKRLEETLSYPLFLREKRSLKLTSEGKLLLDYARNIVNLHDEVRARISESKYTGEVRLGAPEDIIEVYFHHILQDISNQFPQLRVTIEEAPSAQLLPKFHAGEIDILLTTEFVGQGLELRREQVVWASAKGGKAAFMRPLPLAQCENCNFKSAIIEVLRENGIEFDLANNAGSSYSKYALIAADLGVAGVMEKQIEGSTRYQVVDDLPALPSTGIYLYQRKGSGIEFLPEIAELVIKRVQA